jgi:hypothetical protein
VARVSCFRGRGWLGSTALYANKTQTCGDIHLEPQYHSSGYIYSRSSELGYRIREEKGVDILSTPYNISVMYNIHAGGCSQLYTMHITDNHNFTILII